MSYVIALVGLAALIFIHELGHFLAAIAVGMRPRSFNIGFGPPVLQVRRRGVLYAIRALPLGGYVKIPGMHRPAASDVDVYFGRAVEEAPELAGPAERLKAALDAGDLETARIALGRLGPRAAGYDARRAEKGLNEIGDALSPEAYWRQSAWRRIVAIIAGPLANVIAAFVLFAVVYGVAGDVRSTTEVREVVAGAPAAKAGLRPGDLIVAINGTAVTANTISDVVNGSRGRPLRLMVMAAPDHTVAHHLGPVAAKYDWAAKRWRLGFVLDSAYAPIGPGEAMGDAARTMGDITTQTLQIFTRIFNKQDREQISSAAGIVKVSSDAARSGWQDALLVNGFISLSLALLNLVPLLPLDGGHILFSLIEGVRRRALRREIYERASAVGLALVLLLFFIGLSNDVGRLGG